MSLKRRWMFEADDDSLRLLALQAHQISGTLDPRTPIRALLRAEGGRLQEPRAGGSRFAVAGKLNEADAGRLVNEGLAPAGLS